MSSTSLSHSNSPSAGAIIELPSRQSEPDAEDFVDEIILEANYKDKAIDDTDLFHFIEKYTSSTEGFPSYYINTLQDIFYSSNLVTDTLWVENPISGRFQPVPIAQAGASAQILQEKVKLGEDDKQLENAPLLPKPLRDEHSDIRTKFFSMPPLANRWQGESDDISTLKTDEWLTVTMDYRNFSFVKRSLFLVFQGLLAGFCLTTVFIYETSSSADKDASFLQSYQPMAQEIRRYFYLLTCISLVGSMDNIVTTWQQITTTRNPLREFTSSTLSNKLEDYQRTSLIGSGMISILYWIAFISCCIIAPFEVIVYTGNFDTSGSSSTLLTGGGPSSGDWIDVALADRGFERSFSRWKTLNRLRAGCSLLAWLLCCFFLWKDISRYNKLWDHLRQLRQTALSWMRRAKSLEGDEGIDRLDKEALEDIIQSLEIGLQRTKTILNFKEMENPSTKPSRLKS